MAHGLGYREQRPNAGHSALPLLELTIAIAMLAVARCAWGCRPVVSRAVRHVACPASYIAASR